jgi:tRNA(Arg) A34 adenosine deaminase TadA
MLAEDHNTVLTDGDVNAHPELKLAQWAAQSSPPDVPAKTTMYTSCQPCLMCAGAVARSGLGGVTAFSNEQGHLAAVISQIDGTVHGADSSNPRCPLRNRTSRRVPAAPPA